MARLVNASLKPAPGTVVPAVIQTANRAATARDRARARRQRWMLLLAFEILVFGFAQAAFQPVRRPGITVEQTVTPNHVVT